MTPAASVDRWIKSFDVKNFLGQYNYHVEFLEKPYITGPTGSGKSLLLTLLWLAADIVQHGHIGVLSECPFYFGYGRKPFDEFTLETFNNSIKVVYLDRYHFWVTAIDNSNGEIIFESRCEDSSKAYHHDELMVADLNVCMLPSYRFGRPDLALGGDRTLQEKYSYPSTLEELIDTRKPNWELVNLIANVPYMYGEKSNMWDYTWEDGKEPNVDAKYFQRFYRDPYISETVDYRIQDVFIRDEEGKSIIHKPSAGDLAMLMLAICIAGRSGVIIVDDIDLHMHCVTQSQMPQLVRLAATRGIQIIASTNSFHIFANEDFAQSTDLLGLQMNPDLAYNVLEVYNIVPTVANKRTVATQILSAKPGEKIHAFGICVGERKTDTVYGSFAKAEFKSNEVEQMTNYIFDFVNDPEHLIAVPKNV